MLMVQCSLDIIDRRIGHAAPFKDLEPFLGRPLLGFIFNESVNIRTVLDPVAVRDEAGVSLPLRESKTIA